MPDERDAYISLRPVLSINTPLTTSISQILFIVSSIISEDLRFASEIPPTPKSLDVPKATKVTSLNSKTSNHEVYPSGARFMPTRCNLCPVEYRVPYRSTL